MLPLKQNLAKNSKFPLLLNLNKMDFIFSQEDIIFMSEMCFLMFSIPFFLPLIMNFRLLNIKVFTKLRFTSKFGEFISPAEVAVVCLKYSLSFIKFCSLVSKLWLICGFKIKGNKSCTTDTV